MLLSIQNIIAVGAGGAIGAILRIGVTHRIAQLFPSFTQAGTLCVNVIGSLLIGLLWGIGERSEMSLALRLFIVSGGLGAFTTFSTFALDAVSLSKGKGLSAALLYILLSNSLSILAVFFGHRLSERLLP